MPQSRPEHSSGTTSQLADLSTEDWANEILQRGRRPKHGFYHQPISLENEINSYLADAATGTEILLFWQVSAFCYVFDKT